jgi:hypothetical protein
VSHHSGNLKPLINHVAPNLVGVGEEGGNGAEMEKKKFR